MKTAMQRKALGISFISTALILASVLGYQIWQNHQLLKDGVSGSALVLSKETRLRNKVKTFSLKVAISTTAGIVAGEDSVPRETWNQTKLGSTVDVFYSQANPSNFSFGKQPPQRMIGYMGVQFLIGLSAILAITGSIFMAIGFRTVDPPILQRKPPSRDLRLEKKTEYEEAPLIISVSNAGLKYRLEVPLFILCSIGFILFGTLLLSFGWDELFSAGTSLEKRLMGGVMVSITFSMAYLLGVHQVRNSLAEAKLYQKTQGKEFVLNSTEMRVSIALLEGKGRSETSKKQEPYLNLPWVMISEFTVCPPRRQGKNNVSAYYRIRTRSKEEYFILRRGLKDREKQILERCQYHLQCPIHVEDGLFDLTEQCDKE